MFRKISIVLVIVFAGLILQAQQKTLQERLGYSKNAKLLIIHADDLGVSHSENQASFTALERGSVRSASIMVPTPWFTEVAGYAASHPQADLGLHLTLTSEWDMYKWGPLANQVNGLKNRLGYFYSTVDSVYRTATAAEVKQELRAQIEKAREAGIDFTHLDSHMGTLYGRADYLKAMIELGHEYKVPVMLQKPGPGSEMIVNLDSLINDNDVIADAIVGAGPADFTSGMAAYYTKTLKALKPGLSILIIHTAYDDKEMQAVTIGHPDWGAAWRQADYDFFTNDSCKKMLKEQGIQVITWREIRDKLIR